MGRLIIHRLPLRIPSTRLRVRLLRRLEHLYCDGVAGAVCAA